MTDHINHKGSTHGKKSKRKKIVRKRKHQGTSDGFMKR